MPTSTDSSPALDSRVSVLDSPSTLARLSVLVLSLVVVAAHGPFLALYADNLWRFHPHYEFAPLVLAGFLFLLWRRWPRATGGSRVWLRLLATMLLAVGWLTLAGSTLVFFPWFTAVAMILTAGGLLVHLHGKQAISELFPVWLLLWLVIYPPKEFDDRMIRTLQSFTTLCSSKLLDLIGIYHLRIGHVIRLPDRELFVAEACSGVHSQLVLIACAALLVVFERRHWLHSLLLLASAVFWAAVTNVSRVTIVTVVYAQFNVDLSTGWQHELLGYGVVVVGFAMVLCTDQLLRSLLAGITKDELLHEQTDPLSRFWNWAVGAGKRTSRSKKTPESARGNANALTSPDVPDVPNLPDRLPVIAAKRQAGKWRSLLLWAIPFACVGALQVLIVSVGTSARFQFKELAGTVFQETTLPNGVSEWERTDYALEQRESGSDLAKFSHIWLYSTPVGPVHVSADYPLFSWHELPLCYEGRGWAVTRRQVRNPSSDNSMDGAFIEVDLRRPTGEQGLLLFSLFDTAGEPLDSPETGVTVLWRRLRNRLALNPLVSVFDASRLTASLSATTVQTQLFVTAQRPFGPEERRAMSEQYQAFRHALRQQWTRNGLR